jgi:hypothetical protein
MNKVITTLIILSVSAPVLAVFETPYVKERDFNYQEEVVKNIQQRQIQSVKPTKKRWYDHADRYLYMGPKY